MVKNGLLKKFVNENFGHKKTYGTEFVGQKTLVVKKKL